MGFSSWLYTNSTKKVVKIVYPGGHTELYERPILAADILLRNPRSCVAHPYVFQQPWAIVAQDTTLMPGQKFYVVPITTIRKFQQLSLKYCPSFVQQVQTNQSCKVEIEDHAMVNTCWLIKTKKTCLNKGISIKARREDSSEETRSSSSLGYSELKARKRTKNVGSPKRLTSLVHWEPNLHSINEE